MKYRLRYISLAVLILTIAGIAAAQPDCAAEKIFGAADCKGDSITSAETTLLSLINKYRAANGRPELRPSGSLSKLANRRMLDLKTNMRRLTHSWSNCAYEISDQKTWPCVMDAPKRLKSGYSGQGYETLYRSTGKAEPGPAIEAWKKSSLHNSIILNQGIFKDMPWDEMGVAIDGEYAALWFGYAGKETTRPGEKVVGLGVSFDQAIAGLSKILSIDEKSSTVTNNVWQGTSRDKKIRLEIAGTRKEITETDLTLKIKLEPDRTLDADSRSVTVTLLKNIFPEWTDIGAWIDTSVKTITANRTAYRTKLVRKIAIDMRAVGTDGLSITLTPQAKPVATEIF